ncbi:MAG: hypothetical protein AABY26_01310 [Nanoarchaeota archaeon]
MTPTNRLISLYHGGRKVLVDTISGYGLNQEKIFYCSRQRSLADAAADSFGIDGRVLKIDLPASIFSRGIAEGFFEERLYLGSIPIDYALEVVVKPGRGIDIINHALLFSQRPWEETEFFLPLILNTRTPI